MKLIKNKKQKENICITGMVGSGKKPFLFYIFNEIINKELSNKIIYIDFEGDSNFNELTKSINEKNKKILFCHLEHKIFLEDFKNVDFSNKQLIKYLKNYSLLFTGLKGSGVEYKIKEFFMNLPKNNEKEILIIIDNIDSEFLIGNIELLIELNNKGYFFIIGTDRNKVDFNKLNFNFFQHIFIMENHLINKRKKLRRTGDFYYLQNQELKNKIIQRIDFSSLIDHINLEKTMKSMYYFNYKEIINYIRKSNIKEF